MYIFRKFIYLCSIIGVFLSLPNTAFAAAENCLDGNNLVCITETFDAEQSSLRNDTISRYSITNNSETQIFAFAVTNASGNGLQAYIGEGLSGWSSRTLGQDHWDRTRLLIDFTHPSVSNNWITGTDLIGRTGIGNFNDLFGESEGGNTVYANLYWNNTNANDLTTDVTLNEFFFYGMPESNFVAFDQNGGIIASSLTSVAAVPEPSQYALLLVGLGVIGLFRKYKSYQL